MLIDYVLNPRARRRLQELIDASLLDEFTDWLAGRRYSRGTIHSYVYATARLVIWARANCYRELSTLDSFCLNAYRNHLSKIHGSAKRAHLYSNDHSGAQRFVRFLCECGIAPAEPSDIPPLVMLLLDAEATRHKRGHARWVPTHAVQAAAAIG